MLQVVALDIDLPVKQAFHILHEQACPPFLLPSHTLCLTGKTIQ